MHNNPANLGRMAEHFEALTPPRRPLRLRRWAFMLLAVLAGIMAVHLAAKAIPQTAFDAVQNTAREEPRP